MEDDSEDDGTQEEWTGQRDRAHDGLQNLQDFGVPAEEEHSKEELGGGQVEAAHKPEAEESGQEEIEQLETAGMKALKQDCGKVQRTRKRLSLEVGTQQVLSPNPRSHRRLPCLPPRTAALLAVAHIALHGTSQTAAGNAAHDIGDRSVRGGCGSEPSGAIKRTRHKSSTAAGTPGGNHGTHQAADGKEALTGRQQEQHKHGRNGPAADDTIPRCGCGVVYRDRPGQPNGFFARGSHAYTCNSCCLRNKKETGFYGPPGTRSLEEAGGRACEECAATDTYKWYPHKHTRAAYACSRCYEYFKCNGTYRSVATSPRTTGGRDGGGQKLIEGKHGGMKRSNPSHSGARCLGDLPDDSDLVKRQQGLRQARKDQKLDQQLPQEKPKTGRPLKHGLQPLPTQQMQTRPLLERVGKQHSGRGRNASIPMQAQMTGQERSASLLNQQEQQSTQAANAIPQSNFEPIRGVLWLHAAQLAAPPLHLALSPPRPAPASGEQEPSTGVNIAGGEDEDEKEEEVVTIANEESGDGGASDEHDKKGGGGCYRRGGDGGSSLSRAAKRRQQLRQQKRRQAHLEKLENFRRKRRRQERRALKRLVLPHAPGELAGLPPPPDFLINLLPQPMPCFLPDPASEAGQRLAAAVNASIAAAAVAEAEAADSVPATAADGTLTGAAATRAQQMLPQPNSTPCLVCCRTARPVGCVRQDGRYVCRICYSSTMTLRVDLDADSTGGDGVGNASQAVRDAVAAAGSSSAAKPLGRVADGAGGSGDCGGAPMRGTLPAISAVQLDVEWTADVVEEAVRLAEFMMLVAAHERGGDIQLDSANGGQGAADHNPASIAAAHEPATAAAVDAELRAAGGLRRESSAAVGRKRKGG